MDPRVCVVTGVGPGTGAALARRFAADGGYRVALIARNAERLEKLAAELPGARAYPVDVSDLDALRAALASVRTELGAPSVLLHNAVAGGFGTFDTVTPEAFELRFEAVFCGFSNLAALIYYAIVIVVLLSRPVADFYRLCSNTWTEDW